MKLYYYKDPKGNFGDDINKWLWDRLIPEAFLKNDDTYLSVIGTILSGLMPKDGRCVVLGSGVGYDLLPAQNIRDKWSVLSVRGPLSAKILKLDANKAVTDGAILLAALPEYQPLSESERSGVVFMPHHGALYTGRWQDVCEQAGVTFLDPRADAKETIEKIRSSKLVLADAMHAAIVADTMRVPWVPLASSSQINSFKWLDWTMSMNLPYEPIKLFPSTPADAIKSKWLHIIGVNYLLKVATPDLALAHYHLSQEKSGTFWLRLMKKIDWHDGRIVNKFLTMPVIGSLLRAVFFNGFLVSRSATQFRELTKSKSYLSNDDIFQDRLEKMKKQLEQLR